MQAVGGILLGFCILCIQFVWFRHGAAWGLAPDVALLAAAFAGLLRGPGYGQVFGFCLGLACDTMFADLFGARMLVYTLTGFAAGHLSRQWDESKYVTHVMLAALVSVAAGGIMCGLNRIFAPDENLFRSETLLIFQPLYNIVLAPLVFRLMGIIGRRAPR